MSNPNYLVDRAERSPPDTISRDSEQLEVRVTERSSAMHEMSIAMSVVEAVVDRARQEGCSRVSGIDLVVGRLAGVEVESLRFCFDAATRNTPVEGAKLSIEEREGSAICEECGAGFPVESYHVSCPSCGRFRVRIVSGEELAVKSITIE